MLARYLLLAQVAFFVALATCALIEPQGLVDNHGWSYYEGRSATIVPYLLGILVSIALILHASQLVKRTDAPKGLGRGLWLLALFLFLDVATPDTVNALFYWAHDLTSALLFVYQLGLGLWLVRTVWRTRLGATLVSAQVVGGLVAMLSQLQLIPLLGLGIFVFQASFGVLLVLATAGLRSLDRVNELQVEDATATAVN
jgi:hypothetical protein